MVLAERTCDEPLTHSVSASVSRSQGAGSGMRLGRHFSNRGRRGKSAGECVTLLLTKPLQWAKSYKSGAGGGAMSAKPGGRSSYRARDGEGVRGPNFFHGDLVREDTLGGFRVSEVAYPSGLDIPTHAHQHAYLGITLRGASVQWCGSQTRFSQPWTVTYHPPQEVHRDHFESSGALGLNVEFKPGFLERLAMTPSLWQRGIHSSHADTAWLAARLYREFLQADEPAVAGVEGLTLELLAHLWRVPPSPQGGKPPLWLQRVTELLRVRFAENLNLLYLSKTVGVHPTHLARIFRKYQRCTVGDFVRRLRIEHACREISQHHRPLADVALASGFCDQSRFSKTFRDLTGMTPREYQETSRRAKCRQKG